MGIFGACVDVALGCADGDAGNGHALDQDEGIAFHDHTIGKGPAIAFIGVADDIFLRARGIENRLPFDPGREARTAATAQAGFRHLRHDLGGCQLKGVLQTLKTVMGAIVFERNRISYAATGKGQACLFARGRAFDR